ncbi:MAG TPA: TolC family protein [Acidobacteriota bacterium]|nr:TolC family protein [Acidobacteriota bacterium]
MRIRWLSPVLRSLVLLSVTVPTIFAQTAPLELTLQKAVELALSEDGNTRVRISEVAVDEARANSRLARAPLLPHVEAGVLQQRQTRNLEAIGLRAFESFRPPTLVGPFGTFDARGSVSQALLDLSGLWNLKASKVAVEAAQRNHDRTRDETATDVARAFLYGLLARERLAVAKANTELARSLKRLAEDQLQAGTGTRIEVTRADVQLSHELQQELEAENALRDSILVLLRLIGLDLNRPVRLSGTLKTAEESPPSLEELLALAFSSRSDLQSRLKEVEEAELRHQSARLKRLPRVAAFADYGTIGTEPGEAIPTWTAGLSLRFPIFDGGTIEADTALQAARLKQQRLQLDDLRDQIELEVRQALEDVEVAHAQLEVSRKGQALAEDELERARRRYQAGVTTSLEVAEAQTRLERARDNRVQALFKYNLARLELANSTGTIESFVLLP